MFVHARFVQQLSSRFPLLTLSRTTRAFGLPSQFSTLTSANVLTAVPALSRSFLTSSQVSYAVASPKGAKPAAAPKIAKKPAAKATTKAATTKSATKAGSVKTAVKKTAVKKTAVKRKAAAGTVRRKSVARIKVAKKKVVKPKKPARVPKELHPPKRAVPAYLLYYRHFLTLHPKPANTQELLALASKCSTSWKALSDSEKQPYTNEYNKAKEAVDKKRLAYFRDVDPAVLRAINKENVKRGKPKIHSPKDDGRLKRPLGSFMRFSVEQRSKLDPKLSVAEQGKLMGAEWRALSPKQKEVYTEAARKEREVFKTTPPA